MRCAGKTPRPAGEHRRVAVNRVYVIELSPDAGRRRDPRLPWVYVGSSARSPEERFAQHLRGYKASRMPRRFGLRLRPDLYEDLSPIRGKRMAVAVEEERARDLADCGFVAHCDGTSFGADGGDWREWDAGRLQPVVHHVDAAIDELAGCSFVPLDARTCAELLYGTRAFWVAECIDQSDPPPSYGLFPHVRLDVLEERAGARLPTRV